MDLRYIARPYAKAIFMHALETASLAYWSEWLPQAKKLMQHAELMRLVSNPEISKEQLLALFVELLQLDKKSQAFNLLELLISHRRLNAVPFIAEQFAKLYADYEKQVDAEVISAEELSSAQREELIKALEKRLQRKVNLHCTVDKNILGGAIVRADDLVIDGSGRGRLSQLKTRLEAIH